MSLVFPANVGRQWPLVGCLKIAASDIINGTIVTTVAIAHAADLPNDFIVTDGFVLVDTAFDSTTFTLAIGDSVNATRYAATASLTAAAGTSVAFTGTPFHSSTIGNMVVTPTITGTTPTVGLAYVVFKYIIPGRANEVQTN